MKNNWLYLIFIACLAVALIGCGKSEKDDLDGNKPSGPIGPSVRLYSMSGYVTSAGISSEARAAVAPVKNALVFLEELANEVSTSTDENGKYTLNNVPENTYHVVAKTSDGLQMRSAPVAVNETTTGPSGVIEVKQTLEVAKATGSVQVLVIDNYRNPIVSTGTVVFWNSHYLISDGFFTITDVPEELGNESFTVTSIAIKGKTFSNVKVTNKLAMVKLYDDPATSTPVIPPATYTPDIPPATSTPVIPPATSTPVIPPATSTPVIPPATSTPVIPPATSTPVIPPATSTPVIPPATSTPVIPPATSTPVIPPATSTPVIPPATSTPVIPPATSTPVIPPATSTPVIPPATSTPVIPPATSTPVIPPATSTPVIPPATGTPDVPIATGSYH